MQYRSSTHACAPILHTVRHCVTAHTCSRLDNIRNDVRHSTEEKRTCEVKPPHTTEHGTMPLVTTCPSLPHAFTQRNMVGQLEIQPFVICAYGIFKLEESPYIDTSEHPRGRCQGAVASWMPGLPARPHYTKQALFIANKRLNSAQLFVKCRELSTSRCEAIIFSLPRMYGRSHRPR